MPSRRTFGQRINEDKREVRILLVIEVLRRRTPCMSQFSAIRTASREPLNKVVVDSLLDETAFGDTTQSFTSHGAPPKLAKN